MSRQCNLWIGILFAAAHLKKRRVADDKLILLFKRFGQLCQVMLMNMDMVFHMVVLH